MVYKVLHWPGLVFKICPPICPWTAQLPVHREERRRTVAEVSGVFRGCLSSPTPRTRVRSPAGEEGRRPRHGLPVLLLLVALYMPPARRGADIKGHIPILPIAGCRHPPAGVLRPPLVRSPQRSPARPLAPPPPGPRGLRLPCGIPGLPPPLRPRDLVLRHSPRPGRPCPPRLSGPRGLRHPAGRLPDS